MSHHLARLEAATGVRLVQKAGRGIRLTPEGRLLADRAAEIAGRVGAATTELQAQAGLRSGRVRVAANASTAATIVPRAAVVLAERHPGLDLTLVERHPADAVRMLRHGEVEIAVVFRRAGDPVPEGCRSVHLGDDPLHLISRRPGDSLAHHRDSAWIGGCDACQAELEVVCRDAGFTPRTTSHSDDMVVVQALVAAGAGVALLAGLGLRAHRRQDVHATVVPAAVREIHAVTYGDPPDPPGVAAVLTALREVAGSLLAAPRPPGVSA
ncbi:LysR family transcriptional regulator [Lentzea sp. NPDC003310]|uniref:LysR family transcriptional regulator n=1 Tax=Lentzea sp. NPDC003310 TaxID=3154447 RepID=UPI00339E8E91